MIRNLQIGRKGFQFYFGLILFVLCINLSHAAPPAGNWHITFEDEFTAPLLDDGKWTIREGSRRDGYWSKDALSISNGQVHLATILKNERLLSGSIDTKGKFEQRFGYFEARCSLPTVPGHWSAFWLLSREFGQSNDAGLSGAEIDIFEYHIGLGAAVHHAVHWPKYGSKLLSKKHISPLTEDNQNPFHTFGLLWEKNSYTFFVDNVKAWEMREGVSNVAQFVLLSNEVGKWAGNIRMDLLPDKMSCDFIRVYSRIE